MPWLEFRGGGIPGSAVTTLGVLEHLDGVGEVDSCVVARLVDRTADAFTLEQLEEALGHGVAVAVPTTLMQDTRL